MNIAARPCTMAYYRSSPGPSVTESPRAPAKLRSVHLPTLAPLLAGFIVLVLALLVAEWLVHRSGRDQED